MAAVPALLLALVQLDPTSCLAIGLGYMVINMGISYLLEPIVMGYGLGLSPLIVFISLFFWGWIWGPLGMLLSVPLTMVVKIVLERSVDFQVVSGSDGRSATPARKGLVYSTPFFVILEI